MSEGTQPAQPPAAATERPAKELPTELEAELQRRGIHHRDWIGASRHSVALRDEFTTKKGTHCSLHPLHPGNPGFDFETIFASLDGEVDSATLKEMDDVCARRAVLKMSSLVVALIFDWLLQVNLQGDRLVKAVGVRACAAAWVVDPEHFDGASLTTLSKRLDFKGASSLSPAAAEFSRRFGISNHYQSHCRDKEKIYETSPARN